MAQPTHKTTIETITHGGEVRRNIPTAELENLVSEEEAQPQKAEYPRKNNPADTPELYARNGDLDPQLVWQGKDAEDNGPLTVDAVPIYVQEYIHPKAIIDAVKNHGGRNQGDETAPDLFADWAGELDPEDRIEFYQHDQKWTNRMILGDALQVMTSLAEKEGLKGRVQCIYFDPPYGIKFRSNWQQSTGARDVKDKDVSFEPDAIRAFRDTWQKGINSYLSYIRDRLTLGRELLTESGSLFLQIGDENAHLLRSVLDEVFGRENYINTIAVKKKGFTPISESVFDYLIWYAKNKEAVRINPIFADRTDAADNSMFGTLISKYGEKRRAAGMTAEEVDSLLGDGWRLARLGYPIVSQDPSKTRSVDYEFQGSMKSCGANKHWRFDVPDGLKRLERADRLHGTSGNSLGGVVFFDDRPAMTLNNLWDNIGGAANPIYVVQTNTKIVQRCILMASAPGDLVLDPTCGSGTTATVAEQWGRRWITIDTSRVALALARSRLMGSHFDYYLLADSEDGIAKEQAVSGKTLASKTPTGNINHGFVYQRVPHTTLASIARNDDIDTIWKRYEGTMGELKNRLNTALQTSLNDWEIPTTANNDWGQEAQKIHAEWIKNRQNRQAEIDQSIAQKSTSELLYDRPYKKSNTVRVTGPFTVESLSPHRILPTDSEDEALLQQLQGEDGQDRQTQPTPNRPKSMTEGETRFLDIIFENLKKAGVQNTKKGERLEFQSLEPWLNPNRKASHVHFDGRYIENGRQKKAAICVGPEYGTVTKSLMIQAAKEAADFFDILIVLGFAFEAYADEGQMNIGRFPVLSARMNNDLHMADRLKSGKSGNLFVMFGEPDIELHPVEGDKFSVEIKGVDIFDPTTGDVNSSGPEDIACWFIDTDYNEEAFFVRHAYFSGGGVPDPFKRLKTTLKGEINPEAWESLYKTISRPFPRPPSGRIAVKAINHYGDEVLKVFDV